jgi:hypothetical protein
MRNNQKDPVTEMNGILNRMSTMQIALMELRDAFKAASEKERRAAVLAIAGMHLLLNIVDNSIDTLKSLLQPEVNDPVPPPMAEIRNPDPPGVWEGEITKKTNIPPGWMASDEMVSTMDDASLPR